MPDKIQVEIEVTGDGELKFRKLTDAAKDFGTKATSAFAGMTGAFNVFSGVLAADSVKAAFNSLIGFGKTLFDETFGKGIKQAIETEDAINALNQSLVASGKYSQAASEELVQYAGALQATTKFSDDAILKSQALLQGLVRLDTDGLKRATKAALDLSAGLGQDLNTSTLQIAKAMEGSAGRLSGYGLKLDEANTKAQNFDKTLQFVNSRFGGAAEAQVNTYGGALAVLGHQVEDVQKEFGFAVIQNQSLINVIKEAGQIVDQFQKAVAANRNGIRDLVSNGIILAVDGMSLLVSAGQAAYVTFLRLEQATLAVTQKFALFKFNFTDGAKAVSDAVNQNVQKFNELSAEIDRIKKGESAFTAVKDAVGKLRDAAVAGLGATADTSNLATRSLQAQKSAVEELTAAQIKLGQEGRRIAEEELKKNDPQADFEAKQAALEEAVNQRLISVQFENDSIVRIVKERNDKISENETKLADDILSRNQFLIEQKQFGTAQEIQDNQAKLQQILAADNLSVRDRQKIEQQYATQSKSIEQGRAQAITDAISALATLQNSKTREIAVIGKAAAIAQATIDTYRGASAAAAAVAGIPVVGPFLAEVVAASFIAAGVARVAQIVGTPLATGLDQVPAGYPNDTFPARLSSGEGVIDSGTNKELKMWLAGSGQMVPLLQGIYSTLQQLKLQVVVNIGTRTLVNEFFDAADSGRVINI